MFGRDLPVALEFYDGGRLGPADAPATVEVRSRDAQSISLRYDVSNDFYETVLGPAMTYSCALFTDPGVSLEAAQWSKLELVCSKLGLTPQHGCSTWAAGGARWPFIPPGTTGPKSSG